VNDSAPLHDVQGLLARGYGSLPAALFLILGFDRIEPTRAWLRRVVSEITPSDRRPERRAVHIAFTASGLGKLGVQSAAMASFSNEFADGMTTKHRSRILGDTGASAPEAWNWGGPTTPEVDGVLLLYACDDHELAHLERDVAAVEGMSVIARLETSDLQGREPFGFHDGISQPIIEGLSKRAAPETTLRFGEFVLGYPNEYGRYTDRPLLDHTADPARTLPREPATGRPDLGRNGSYLVFRQLDQDVFGFWRFLDAVSRAPDGTPQPDRRLKLAAKMVGRWPSGAPLTLAPEADDGSLKDANDFGYHQLDSVGQGCPIGAHIRRSNPRDSLDPDPGTAKSYAINRRHRILRRGREYGTPLTVDQALQNDHDPAGTERGLHFICLNANIARQFEFVSGTWLNDPKFAGLYDDADPLVGPSEPYGGTFTIPSDPVRERVTKVPRFVSVKGGAYFFMPGIEATRYLASTDTR
jgi:Dyp-type peroxidase family